MTARYGLLDFDHFNNQTITKPDYTTETMIFSPSGKYLAILRQDGQVAFYDSIN